jgi:hypothetical protein
MRPQQSIGAVPNTVRRTSPLVLNGPALVPYILLRDSDLAPAGGTSNLPGEAA